MLKIGKFYKHKYMSDVVLCPLSVKQDNDEDNTYRIAWYRDTEQGFKEIGVYENVIILDSKEHFYREVMDTNGTD